MKRLSQSPLRRWVVASTGVGAILLVSGVLATTGANAATHTVTSTAATHTAAPDAASIGNNPDPTSGPHREAYDPMTGKMVTVYKPKSTTPVHPEKVTHPAKDSMGKVTSAHSSGKSSSSVTPAVTQLPGIDVSSYQGDISWSSVAPHIDFSYAKATESTNYTNPYFSNQYTGPYNAGLIRGAYHFAVPNNSGGSTQADYFLAHGGGWSKDGKTLPGALDIEYNPYGSECYGLSQSAMTSWIWSFVNEYAYKTGVYPVIYSTYDWWHTCTSSDSGFAKYDPFWIADYSSSAGTLPAGYTFYTFWQYADSGSYPGDQDVFNGAYSQLQAIANG
ncbi:MAG: lysozyme [Nocardiopsaceae bacterium]|nr:lysozyme [Nocardiopsaceae bacterium]